MKKSVILLTLAATGLEAGAQNWLDTGNPSVTLGTNFLGAINNAPIDIRTNNTLRFRLNHNVNYTIGAFATQAKNGALGLSPNNTLWVNGPGPFSRIHSHDGTASVLQAPYRPWMDNGMTFTTNSDQMYIGHKVEPGFDQTAAVVQWSDNEFPSAGPDVLKFLFTSSFSGSPTGPNSLNGREIARMHPSGWLGIGDWQAVGLQPDERLDLLSHTIRLRSFVHPTQYRNDSLLRVLVVDSTDGRVYWRPFNGSGDACASGWTMNGNDPVTAFDGNTCPPQSIDRVGIGTNAPVGKLHVRKDVSNGLPTERAGFFHNVTPASNSIGMDALAEGMGSAWNIGGRGIARNSGRSVGLWGIAEADLPNTTNTGVRAEALASPASNLGVSSYASGGTDATGVVATGTGGSSLSTGGRFNGNGGITATGVKALASNGSLLSYGVQSEAAGSTRVFGLWGSATAGSSLNYGVYGTASGPGPSSVFAGYFNGDVMAFGGTYQGSDETLKTGIAAVEVEDHPDVIPQIKLHTYQYAHDAHPSMNLPQGDQLGVLAQELEEVLPHLVKQAVQPAVVDSLGNELHPEVAFKAVNYGGLIPHLVLAMQKQQARIDVMEEALAACCTADAKHAAPNDMLDANGAPTVDPALERLLAIAPNPFPDHTTVYYTLERPGRIQLLVNSADGRHVQVLHEGVLPAGEHRYEWSTGHLAPGVHYVTLLLDGEPLVKRAVKL